MALYVQTFGFRQPYQILVSDDFLSVPAVQQLDIFKQLANSVQADNIKPMITQCCMEQLYTAGPSNQRTTNLAKSFERRRCNHRTPVPSEQCLKEMIGETNKHRYVLATQSTVLREMAETIPALPVIHFNARGVVVLSPPGTATVRAKNRSEEERRSAGAKELEGIEDGGNVIGGPASNPSTTLAANRGRVKNPNPLSMRKKKSAAPTPASSGAEKGAEAGKKKRQREGDENQHGDADGDANGGQQDVLGGAVEAEDEGRGKKKKKRKRRGKGEVAKAIEELNTNGELRDLETGGVGADSNDE